MSACHGRAKGLGFVPREEVTTYHEGRPERQPCAAQLALPATVPDFALGLRCDVACRYSHRAWGMCARPGLRSSNLPFHDRTCRGQVRALATSGKGDRTRGDWKKECLSLIVWPTLAEAPRKTLRGSHAADGGWHLAVRQRRVLVGGWPIAGSHGVAGEPAGQQQGLQAADGAKRRTGGGHDTAMPAFGRWIPPACASTSSSGWQGRRAQT